MPAPELQKNPASYRDPSGFIFTKDGIVYRQINNVYKSHFDLLFSSGLYQNLVDKQLLLPHDIINDNIVFSEDAYKTIKPVQLPFISYPYEWSFNMLKDAALVTLEIARLAIGHGMILKDATAFNLQFFNGRMVFIDILSFEIYDPAKHWVAYKQFCEHFLAPLALMHYAQLPMQELLLSYPEGIPLRVASKLLPWKSKWNMHLYLHLHMHAKIGARKNHKQDIKTSFSESKLNHILKSLEEAVRSFKLDYKTTWAEYYNEAEQRKDYVLRKKEIISDWLDKLKGLTTALDAGGNDGTFSKLISTKGIYVVSADSDHFAINKLFDQVRESEYIHPLIIDFSNPSPSIGVNNKERISFLERKRFDLVVSLAFIHHICVSKNVPFEFVAEMYKTLGNILIIEFVPKEDEKVQQMLHYRKDVYDWYTEENFRKAFDKYFITKERKEIGSSNRILYLMTTNESNHS